MDKLSFTIYLTTMCNMKCSYCYEKEYKVKSMTLKTADKVIEFICKKVEEKKSEMINIKFHGGEPLLEVDLIRHIMNQIKKRKETNNIFIKYSLTTNGTIFSDEILDVLKEFDLISVSIDGNEEVHNKYRVFKDSTGTFQVVRENIMRMIDKGLKVYARMTVTKDTCGQIGDGIKYLIDLGVRHIDVEINIKNDEWYDDEINVFLYNIKKIFKIVRKFNLLGDDIDIPILTRAKTKPINSLCSGGTSSFTITPEGGIYPCIVAINNPEFFLGQVGKNINNDVVDKIHEIGSYRNEECEGCSRYDYCKATRCKIINKVYTGYYRKPYKIFCLYENIDVKICRLYYNII
ncbi:radical SAM protein [Clostridiaceae bacterium M8S5]|nr:radical SAM protein [Clostridiaceae bacterium M8S5]